MSGIASQVGAYKNISATGNVSKVPCKMLGFFVSTESTGTVRIYDSATTTTSTPVTDTISVNAGTWYNLPVALTAGMYVVIGGTADVTLVFA